MAQACAGTRTVFFVDSTHFVLGAYLGYLWALARLVIRAPSGRQRFNVLGALNALTHELVSVTNETYINALSVCELLVKVADLKLSGPVTLVMEKAAELKIELLFLPAYSPNLNLIERLWKFVRKECLYSKYYEKFEPFKQAISRCLGETTGQHKAELDKLLTLKFQTLESAVPAL